MLKYLKPAGVGRRLALILVLYLMLAITYSIVVPIGRGADEWAHYQYAQFIAQNGRLPATPIEREAAGYKSDWPPLYHLFAAGLTAWIDTEGPPTFKYRADNVRRQLVPALGPEAILHTEDELFPWQQEILVWHLGRFLSIGFSLGTLLVTYFIALEVFIDSRGAEERRSGGAEEQKSRGADNTHHASHSTQYATRNTQHIPRFTHFQTLSLISVAVLAFNPRFLFTGILFSYDSLTLLLASLFLWVAIRVVKGYHPRWGFGALGALAGLALVTKYLTALLPLVIVLLALNRAAGGRGAALRQAQDSGRRSRVAEEEQGSRQHAVRNTQYASRIPHHASRFVRPFVVYLGQAGLAFLLVTGWWFGYLVINFNEIDTYGPVLGTLAPVIRGDASDRTVEEIFAWLSGGQSPPPAHLEKQSYTAWQIIAEFPTTFWGNPVVRPYPLSPFILVMTAVTILAAVGLIISWRASRPASRSRRFISLLGLHCALPVPFMLVRLVGARDALEAVQGRHILFLAGPAVAVLLVWGLGAVVSGVRCQVSGSRVAGSGGIKKQEGQLPETTKYAIRITFYALLGLLLIGAIGQLIFMRLVYPSLLPVRTTPYAGQDGILSHPLALPGGAELVQYNITSTSPATPYSPLRVPTSYSLPFALKVTVIWQAGNSPAPEDYQMELALVDARGWAVSGWLAYQTQAHYPTRAWEAGDVIRDEGWLPLPGVTAGHYEIRLRILGQEGEVIPWQTLTTYPIGESVSRRIDEALQPVDDEEWLLWREGKIMLDPATFHERETAQFTIHNSQFTIHNSRLIGPDNVAHPPASAGPGWANFVIGPDWPSGDYRTLAERKVVLRVAPNGRDFAVPERMTHRLEVNFENQVKLLGYDLPARRVRPGDGLPLTLYWQGLQWMGEDFVIFNRLLDNPQDHRRQVAWGGYDRLARENYSTLLWAPREIVTDGFAVPVDPGAPDGVYMLHLGWYRRVNGQAQSLRILDPGTGEMTGGATSVTIGPVKVGGPPPGVTVESANPSTAVNATLGDQINLMGYDMAIDRVEPAQSRKSKIQNLKLIFYWQALTTPEIDYTVFVHLRNGAGEIVAQNDGPPADGLYPTGLWESGEIIKDEVSLPLDRLEPGRYELVAGMYDFATGERLPVAGSADGSILLQSFEILTE